MRPDDNNVPVILGIEGGGTRTVALLASADGCLLRRVEAGPSNLKLLTEPQLLRRLREVRAGLRGFSKPAALAIGLAGARGEPEWQRIRAAAAKIWPGIPCHATHDLETALAAAGEWQMTSNQPRSRSAATSVTRHPSPVTQVLVLSGTGSCFYARTADGRTARFGGWGHLLGDKGSGYEVGLRALKACVFYLDRDGEWSRLGERILRALQLNEPAELIAWAQAASKAGIAALAEEVFAAAAERDPIAKDILTGAAASLAKDGVACARKLAKAREPVQFVLAGSVLLKQPTFARAVAKQLREQWPGCVIAPLSRESAWGAVELARAVLSAKGKAPSHLSASATVAPISHSPFPIPHSLSPTEQRHPRSMDLDKLSIAEAIELMISEDAKLPAAIRRESPKLERVVGKIATAFKRGGRLFYVGAGTSGRLGILDASECPPTFRVSPELVQGIIAGGQTAVFRAVEGAEDDRAAGERAIQFRGVKKSDVVVGIAASGRTPFVHGALAEARKRGAFTVLLCFNPAMTQARNVAHVVIAPEIGPEILTGSTRLKSGTATKLILNLFTTLAMVRTGKVISNLMVDLNPSNVKLRDRAVRIVRELTGADYETARGALEQSGWVVKAAWQRLGAPARN
ncbi:MAG: N-acetylmuramic acid 6-phosphate etherase [Pedosphaera sp. Tous-C6FEB]|nr:MAG: N-acetylmuramic acid 6-phosphate etherase [Pedosphaera sp. Tous-C6FEB]